MWEACTHEYWNGSLWVVNLIVQKQNDIQIFQIKEITAVENWIWERAAVPFSEPDRPMRSCAFHMPTPLKLVTLHQDLCCVNDCGRCQNSFSLLLEVVGNVQCFTFCPLRLCFVLKIVFVSVLSQFSREKKSLKLIQHSPVRSYHTLLRSAICFGLLCSSSSLGTVWKFCCGTCQRFLLWHRPAPFPNIQATSIELHWNPTILHFECDEVVRPSKIHHSSPILRRSNCCWNWKFNFHVIIHVTFWILLLFSLVCLVGHTKSWTALTNQTHIFNRTHGPWGH